jgi:ABC-type sugar transport system substrate-binding protein
MTGMLVGLALVACQKKGTTEKGVTEKKQEPVVAQAPAPEATPTVTKETLLRALGVTDNVPPLVLEALARSEQPLTQADKDLALKIYRENGGTTGRGTLHVAYATFFGENVWRQVAFMELVLQALSYPEVAKISYASARADNAKAISDVQSFIAQKVDVLILYADNREAMLPVVQEATEAGITVVPYIASPGGEPGKDYLTMVTNDICAVGQAFARFGIEKTGGQGSYVTLGGTPGNPYSTEWQTCMEKGYAGAPGMKALGKADTMWTQEGVFKAASAFLAKEAKIDVWNYDFADGSRGLIRAYEAQKRPLDFVLTVSGDEQGLFGDWERLHEAHPKFKILHGNGGTFQARIALTAALAHKKGQKIPPRIDVPNLMREYVPGSFQKDRPQEMPLSALVPADVVQAMYGK